MNVREQFEAVMDFKPVKTLKWEYAYWMATAERWYQEGLKRSPYSPPLGFPSGKGLIAEACPFPYPPTNPRYKDYDVASQLGFDPGIVRIPINWRFSPLFDEKIIEEDETTRTKINCDGALIREKKMGDSLPQFIRGPITNREDWEKLKEERFNTNNILVRFPDRWEAMGPTFQNRDFLLGIFMDGFFALPREMFLVENQLMMYCLEPALMHDIAERMVEVYLAILEELFPRTDLDLVYFWEDMSFKTGPLISPKMVREFMSPYYKRVTAFLKQRGIRHLFVDTDGDCSKLIPEFLECGIDGMFPFEVNAGMDVVKVRKEYPQLKMMGGLDKMKIMKDRKAINAELDLKLPAMLSQGGYIPFMDHLVPPEVSWDNFCYYRGRISDSIEQYFPK